MMSATLMPSARQSRITLTGTRLPRSVACPWATAGSETTRASKSELTDPVSTMSGPPWANSRAPATLLKAPGRDRLQKVYLRASDPVRERPQRTTRGARQPHAVSRRLGSSTVAALIKAYEGGSTTPQLAEEYGISQIAVKDLLHSHGIALRRPVGLTQEDVDEAVCLYKAGWLLRKIAAKFNVSQEDVRRKLLARGVVMRSGHGHYGSQRR